MSHQIGILGTGRMGTRLARLFADCGHRVLLGSRDVDRAKRLVSEVGSDRLTAATYAEAAQAEFVLPAIFVRDGLYDVLEPLRSALDSKILIDITNPFNATYTDFILPWNTSSAEQLQARFPRTRIVGAFKNVWWEVFDQPRFEGRLSDVYVVGDDADAKGALFNLVKDAPFRFLDAGPLANARIVERMTLFLGELGQRYGWFPRMNWRVLGERPATADVVLCDTGCHNSAVTPSLTHRRSLPCC